MTMIESEIATSGKRYAYFASVDDDLRWVVAIVTENERGFRPLLGTFFESKADAEEHARQCNERIGVAPDEAWNLVLASLVDLGMRVVNGEIEFGPLDKRDMSASTADPTPTPQKSLKERIRAAFAALWSER